MLQASFSHILWPSETKDKWKKLIFFSFRIMSNEDCFKFS